MAYIDVFNGDADGLCALQQLRLAEPVSATLVTGPKRDISLLRRVTADKGDRVTVLDISLDKNRDALVALLAAGSEVRYFDHHYAGEIPAHPALEAHIDTSPQICTSLLVNNYLHGRFARWAVTGAFGDNFDTQARAAAQPLNLPEGELQRLRELGTLLNYNGYGESDESFFLPQELFRRLHPYADPLAFVAEESAFLVLQEGYHSDMALVTSTTPMIAEERIALYILPDTAWARRASGVFANELANQHPQRAHAILTAKPQGGYQVSVRAPLSNLDGADTLCRSFESGGGRRAAAGINHLPPHDLDLFVTKFRAAYASQPA